MTQKENEDLQNKLLEESAAYEKEKEAMHASIENIEEELKTASYLKMKLEREKTSIEKSLNNKIKELETITATREKLLQTLEESKKTIDSNSQIIAQLEEENTSLLMFCKTYGSYHILYDSEGKLKTEFIPASKPDSASTHTHSSADASLRDDPAIIEVMMKKEEGEEEKDDKKQSNNLEMLKNQIKKKEEELMRM